MVAILGFSKEQIHDAVRSMYTDVADNPAAHFHFPVGAGACRLVGYRHTDLDDLPVAAVESFAGVGCPFLADVIRPGDVVLDIGSGSGTDSLIAARMVGDQGKVWALDMTPAMSRKLADITTEHGFRNVETLRGDAEAIPLPDASVDVVTSNGVLNLVPDKHRAVAEIFRVLKPGGRVQIADIVIARPVTADCGDDPALWAECVVGATVDETYLNLFRDAGFEDVAVLQDDDYFAHSPSHETREVAGRFGAHAVVLRMRRGATAPATLVRFARRVHPSRLASAWSRRGLWGFVSLGLAILACYGTLALIAVLSALGFSLAVHEGAWAGAIVLFAILAVASIAAGARRHGSAGPLVPAILGGAMIGYAMFWDYSRAVEIAGFAFLTAAAVWDYRLRRPLPARA
jgi:SAM-dependent methyltransferase